MTSTGEGYVVIQTNDGAATTFVSDASFASYKLLQARILVWGALNPVGDLEIEPEGGIAIPRMPSEVSSISVSQSMPVGEVTLFKKLTVDGITILYETPSNGGDP